MFFIRARKPSNDGWFYVCFDGAGQPFLGEKEAGISFVGRKDAELYIKFCEKNCVIFEGQGKFEVEYCDG